MKYQVCNEDYIIKTELALRNNLSIRQQQISDLVSFHYTYKNTSSKFQVFLFYLYSAGITN